MLWMAFLPFFQSISCSYGAGASPTVYCLTPLVLIIIFIIAAAGITKGGDIFQFFGVGALLGITSGIGAGGAGKGFKAAKATTRVYKMATTYGAVGTTPGTAAKGAAKAGIAALKSKGKGPSSAAANALKSGKVAEAVIGTGAAAGGAAVAGSVLASSSTRGAQSSTSGGTGASSSSSSGGGGALSSSASSSAGLGVGGVATVALDSPERLRNAGGGRMAVLRVRRAARKWKAASDGAQQNEGTRLLQARVDYKYAGSKRAASSGAGKISAGFGVLGARFKMRRAQKSSTKKPRRLEERSRRRLARRAGAVALQISKKVEPKQKGKIPVLSRIYARQPPKLGPVARLRNYSANAKTAIEKAKFDKAAKKISGTKAGYIKDTRLHRFLDLSSFSERERFYKAARSIIGIKNKEVQDLVRGSGGPEGLLLPQNRAAAQKLAKKDAKFGKALGQMESARANAMRIQIARDRELGKVMTPAEQDKQLYKPYAVETAEGSGIYRYNPYFWGLAVITPGKWSERQSIEVKPLKGKPTRRQLVKETFADAKSVRSKVKSEKEEERRERKYRRSPLGRMRTMQEEKSESESHRVEYAEERERARQAMRPVERMVAENREKLDSGGTVRFGNLNYKLDEKTGWGGTKYTLSATDDKGNVLQSTTYGTRPANSVITRFMEENARKSGVGATYAGTGVGAVAGATVAGAAAGTVGVGAAAGGVATVAVGLAIGGAAIGATAAAVTGGSPQGPSASTPQPPESYKPLKMAGLTQSYLPSPQGPKLNLETQATIILTAEGVKPATIIEKDHISDMGKLKETMAGLGLISIETSSGLVISKDEKSARQLANLLNQPLADLTAGQHRRIGELLGTPEADAKGCADAFARGGGAIGARRDEFMKTVSAQDKDTQETLVGFLPYVPNSASSPETLKKAQLYRDTLERVAPEVAASLRDGARDTLQEALNHIVAVMGDAEASKAAVQTVYSYREKFDSGGTVYFGGLGFTLIKATTPDGADWYRIVGTDASNNSYISNRYNSIPNNQAVAKFMFDTTRARPPPPPEFALKEQIKDVEDRIKHRLYPNPTDNAELMTLKQRLSDYENEVKNNRSLRERLEELEERRAHTPSSLTATDYAERQ